MFSPDFLLNLLKAHGVEPSSSCVLDIGTGNGNFTLELANIFLSVVTIDCDTEVVNRINEKIKERKISNIKALHCSADDLPTLGV